MLRLIRLDGEGNFVRWNSISLLDAQPFNGLFSGSGVWLNRIIETAEADPQNCESCGFYDNH
jgi:uncharacterized protein YlzI (FlbEa/FlbD family)